MDIFLVALGLIILIFTFFDFFHTTLSGNGFWYISKGVNKFLSALILKNKSRSLFGYSGLIHILVTALCWLVLLVLGNYLIFVSSDAMVINGTTKVPATLLERFYYTCYLLSTLGIGDYVPGNDFSRTISGILSFAGFILLTTALTYLLTVVNSVLGKRKLSMVIATLGGDVWELYEYFRSNDGRALKEKSSDLRNEILQNSSNFLALPIVSHFMTQERSRATVVQLASLYEVLMVLKNEFPKGSFQRSEIQVMVKSVKTYLNLGLESQENFDHDPQKLAQLRQFWLGRGKKYDQDLQTDRSINATLKGAGWSWEEVYTLEE